jgi:hypothetical protein
MSEEKITILAGGWSASRFDLRKLPGKIIAVNDSAVYAPRWDLCISMDRLWAENRFDWMRRQAKPIWLRRSTIKNFSIEGLAHMRAFDNDHLCTQLSDDAGRLDGTHSGFVALNLAYQMRPADLYLVGFDMQRGPRDEAHWHPQYPWVNKHATGVGRLAEWAGQFAIAARQLQEARIRVHLCGDHSAIKAWKRTDRRALEQACAA